ncbi:MAG: ATP-binding protein, partial [Campylobacterota bacterium]|nr:ATP-binding protein [Campylobacterota bacterium]
AGGIPDNIIDHIFTSNFTTKEKTGGSGVGLHMTKQIVEKTGVTIEVKNVDNGVCFSIVI